MNYAADLLISGNRRLILAWDASGRFPAWGEPIDDTMHRKSRSFENFRMRLTHDNEMNIFSLFSLIDRPLHGVRGAADSGG